MNAALPWLNTRRAEAIETFRVKGVPHRRIEEWKYSDIHSALTAEDVASAGSATLKISGAPSNVEIIDLAKLDEAAPQWLRDHLAAADPQGAMNAAAFGYATGGVALRVPRNVTASTVHLAVSGRGHARVLIVLEEGASLTLFESHDAATGLRNIGTDISVAANAQLSHIVIAPTAATAIRIDSIRAKLARDARYHAHFADFGAQLSRTDVHVTLEGQGSEARLSGVSALAGNVHSDITTEVVHAIGNTHSTQLFKKAAGGRSRAVYQGRVTVCEGADGVDSQQTAKGILLSPRAEIDLKPELIIFADDVKCAHGAAVGDLEAEQIFYLRARGLPEDEARNLLIRAFLEDAVLEIADESLRTQVWNAVETALPATLEDAS